MLLQNALLFIVTLALTYVSGIADLIGNLFTWENASEILNVVLMLLLSGTAIAYRGLIERVGNIVDKYVKYKHPDSELGRKISPKERESLFDLIYTEIEEAWQNYHGVVTDYLGRGLRKALRAVGLR